MAYVCLILFLVAGPPIANAHYISPTGTLTVIVDQTFEVEVSPSDAWDDCTVAASVTVDKPAIVSGAGQKTEHAPVFEMQALEKGTAVVTISFDGVGDECPAMDTRTLTVRVIDPPTRDGTANLSYSSTNLDPINIFTGELFSRKPRELDLGGPMALYFQRYYGSYLRRSSVVGDLGSNWRHNFDARVYWVGNTITYVTHDGRVTDFLLDPGTGEWSQLTNADTPYQLSAGAGQDVVVYDPEDDRIYTFDFTTSSVISGKLVRIEDGHGNSHTVTYDLLNGQIQTVSHGLGRTLTFTYNGDAIPKISVVSDGTRSVSFQYTDPVDTEYLTLATDALLGVTAYAYKDTSANSDHALMLSMTQPRGNIPYVQTFFDNTVPANAVPAGGRVATQTDADGNTFTFDYSGLDTTLTDPLGNTRVHTHTATGEFSNRQDQAGLSFSMGSDATGRRNSITDRLGDTTTYDYHEPSGNLSAVTHADGSTTDFGYGERPFGGLTLHDLTTVTHADGTSESMSYEAMGNVVGHTDQIGNTATATYNANGQELAGTNVVGGTTTNTYRPDGTLGSRTDPASNITTFGYEALKRLNLITFADGSTQVFTYNDLDQLVSTTDGNGNTSTFNYDANGNLIAVTDPLGNTAAYAYDGNDRPLTITDPLGNTVNRSYHPLGEVATLTDENSNTTTLEYDRLNRHISTTDARGRVWRQSYDAEAILASITDPLGNTATFVSDTMGRITQTTSPLGNTNKVSYDVMGRVVTTTDPLGNTTMFTRDHRGLLTGITLTGQSISAVYTRNALGSVTAVTDPNGNVWLRDYDTSGRLTSRTDPLGNTITAVYDVRNRPSLITYPDSLGTVTMGYDPSGNLTSATYSDGTTLNYVFDANDRLTAANGIIQSYDANGRIAGTNGITITRDPGGRITSMTLAPGKSVTYAYDANNGLTHVTDWAGGITTFSYDDAGRLATMTRANGVTTTYGYDADSQLISISEGAISSIALTRDAKGQITAADRDVPLPASSEALASTAHTYNAASQVSGFTYDALGRLTNDGDRTYAWDLASRLTSITEGGTTTTFTYDALGKRLSRTAAGTTHGYLWNQALGLPSVSIEMLNGANLRYFVHTPEGGLLYTIDADTDTRTFSHFDEMGNTIFVTDDAGTVIGTYAYTPYGEPTASSGTFDILHSWQGKYGVLDDHNGLYYMRARYYHSATGRFLSSDPVASINPKRLNPYQYAMNSPLSRSDPFGLFSLDFDDGGGVPWTPATKVTFTAMLNEVDRRITILIGILVGYQATTLSQTILTTDPGELKWRSDIARLLQMLIDLSADIKGDRRLEIEIGPRRPGVAADTKNMAGTWWDDKMVLDPTFFSPLTNSVPPKPKTTDQNLQTLFHELTHLYDTDDYTAYSADNPHQLESLLGSRFWAPGATSFMAPFHADIGQRMYNLLENWRRKTRVAVRYSMPDRPSD